MVGFTVAGFGFFSVFLHRTIQSKPRGIFTDAKLQSDTQRIQDYYGHSGRDLATVEPQVTKLPDNRVDVVFVIHEGKVRAPAGAMAIIERAKA